MAARGGPAVTAVVAGLVVALIAAACAPSGQRFVKNSSEGVYFKIPDDWELYDEDAILEFQEEDLSPLELEGTREGGWQVFFDAAPSPTLNHLGELVTKHPNGQAQVIQLGSQARDTVSMESLRNLIFPIDEVSEFDSSLVELVDGKEIHEDGVRGVQFVFNIDSRVPALIQTGTLEPGTRRYATFNQTTLLDERTETLYVLLVSCSAECYEDNEGTIDDVVESWTVKDR
jgi:hypothetical protein